MPIADCGCVATPAASGQDHLELLGPTLMVQIGFDAAFDHMIAGAVPQLTSPLVPALVDSGATQSCIDIELANQLQLPIIDKSLVAGIGGQHEVPVFMAQMFAPALEFTVYGAFAGVHLMAGGQFHKALIGRTFLRDMILVYDGRTGIVTISK